ncbi:hypothetical protein [Mycobacterium sp.]|uniref:hypothetical protein n=1 Tax=Mycobacterium sp. TaxID=1785 RepID=UPI003F993568
MERHADREDARRDAERLAAIERQRIREEAERLAEVQAVDWTRDGEPAGRRIFWLELESRWGRAAKGIA